MRADPEPTVRLHSETRSDGSILIRQEAEIEAFPRCMSDRFLHWAQTDPDRVWIAERGPDGAWVRVTYGQGAAAIRSIGAALLTLACRSSGPC
jgi:feruloyl-CoA synthase